MYEEGKIVIRSHRKVGKLWKRTTNVPFPALSTSLCLHREHFPCSETQSCITAPPLSGNLKLRPNSRLRSEEWRGDPSHSKAKRCFAAKIKNDIKQQRAQFYSWHGSTLTIFFPFFHWWWPWKNQVFNLINRRGNSPENNEKSEWL